MVILVRCSAVWSRDSGRWSVDVLWQAVAGRDPVESSGVRRPVHAAHVPADRPRRICDARHFYCRMLRHRQPQPTVPYACTYRRSPTEMPILPLWRDFPAFTSRSRCLPGQDVHIAAFHNLRCRYRSLLHLNGSTYKRSDGNNECAQLT